SIGSCEYAVDASRGIRVRPGLSKRSPSRYLSWTRHPDPCHRDLPWLTRPTRPTWDAKIPQTGVGPRIRSCRYPQLQSQSLSARSHCSPKVSFCSDKVFARLRLMNISLPWQKTLIRFQPESRVPRIL